jgi:hypothetical protein
MSWGVDYASVDGNRPPNWATFKAAGGSFAWLRASFAYYDHSHAAWALVSDPTFARDWKSIPAELIRGAYMGPAIMTSHSAEEQVAVFEKAVRNQGGLRAGLDFAPCIDAEFPQGISGTGMDRAGVVEWLRKAAVAMKSAFGVSPIIYTSGRVWNDSDTDCLGDPFAPAELLACDLWLARYAYKTRIQAILPPPDGNDPPVPHPWGDEWMAHQDQGDALGVPGFSATTDVDRFRGAIQGDHGGHVKRAQERLGLASTDGVFGQETAAALRAYQTLAGLRPDAILGPKSYCALTTKNLR